MSNLGELGSHAIQAVLGTFGVSIIVKLIDGYFHLREKTVDTTVQFREELHTRINELLAQLRQSQSDLDQWKQKYWEQYQAMALLRARHQALCLRYAEATGEAPPPEEDGQPEINPPSAPPKT